MSQALSDRLSSCKTERINAAMSTVNKLRGELDRCRRENAKLDDKIDNKRTFQPT